MTEVKKKKKKRVDFNCMVLSQKFQLVVSLFELESVQVNKVVDVFKLLHIY